MSKTPLLELRNISYSYPGHTSSLLNGINLQIDNEHIGLIGSNGCGKTTLLQIIMGLIQVDTGEILLDGTVLEQEKDFRNLRRKLGFLFQNSDDQLFSPTVLEDVAFGPLNHGLKSDDAKEISIATLEPVLV